MEAFTKKPATYEDVLAAPEGMLAQLVDGELIATPRPGVLHGLAVSTWVGTLFGPFDKASERSGAPGGWWFLYGVELHLGRDVLVPDLAGWRRERVPELPDAPALSVAPDWICEVLSPGTEGLDRVKKMRRYAAHGVQHAWLVNPREKTLEVLERQGSALVGVAAFGGDEKVRAAPFEALEIELATLWERGPG